MLTYAVSSDLEHKHRQRGVFEVDALAYWANMEQVKGEFRL